MDHGFHQSSYLLSSYKIGLVILLTIPMPHPDPTIGYSKVHTTHNITDKNLEKYHFKNSQIGLHVLLHMTAQSFLKITLIYTTKTPKKSSIK